MPWCFLRSKRTLTNLNLMSKDQKPTSFCVQQKEIFSIRPCQTGIAAATRMKKTQTKTKKKPPQKTTCPNTELRKGQHAANLLTSFQPLHVTLERISQPWHLGTVLVPNSVAMTTTAAHCERRWRVFMEWESSMGLCPSSVSYIPSKLGQ